MTDCRSTEYVEVSFLSTVASETDIRAWTLSTTTNLFGLAQLHSSITVENREDLERVQKTVLKIILGLRYKSYQNALDILELETLEKRREKLCLNFARKASKHPNARTCFHSMKRYIKWRQEGPQNSKFWMQILNV